MQNTDKNNIEQMNALLGEVTDQAKAAKIPVNERVCPNIKINTRAKTRFAACKKELVKDRGRLPEINYTIEVSNRLFQCSEKEIKAILAHEILHTCPGCMNHGKRWKSYASIMSSRYGYDIKRTTSYEDLGIEPPERKAEPRYIITCSKCGAKTTRQKKSKLVTNTKNYRCRCGGKLTCSENRGVEK